MATVKGTPSLNDLIAYGRPLKKTRSSHVSAFIAREPARC